MLIRWHLYTEWGLGWYVMAPFKYEFFIHNSNPMEISISSNPNSHEMIIKKFFHMAVT